MKLVFIMIKIQIHGKNGTSVSRKMILNIMTFSLNFLSG